MSGLSLNPDIHHSKVFSSGEYFFRTVRKNNSLYFFVTIIENLDMYTVHLFNVYSTYPI